MRLLDVRRREVPALIWAASWFFCVLAAYYAIRPVRETFASNLDSDQKANLFTMTLVVMLVATPIYGWVVSRVARKLLVPIVYGFFVSNLMVFWWLLASEQAVVWVSGAFFVWISVFNLFVVTLFWGTIVDLFSGEQGKRLFGLIFGAGTLGQLASSWGVQTYVERIGVANLLWLSTVLLIFSIFCSWQVRRQFRKIPANEQLAAQQHSVTWSDVWQGVIAVGRSPYLRGIAMFICAASLCATMVYFQMTELVGEQFENDEQRTSWFAAVNAWQAIVTLLLQTVVVGWLLRTIGVGRTLVLVPIVLLFGFFSLATSGSLFVIGVFQVALRSASFSLGNPALEVLYTAVQPEQKYRAKAFIDTVGKRTGDVFGGQLYALLAFFGWSAASMSVAMLPVTLGIAVLCLILGSAHQQAAAIAEIDDSD